MQPFGGSLSEVGATPIPPLSSRAAMRRALRAAGYRGSKSRRNRATEAQAFQAIAAARIAVQAALEERQEPCA